MAKIRHIAIFTDDPVALGEFYVETFGMEKRGETRTPKGGHAVWLTDGYLELAIILPEDRDAPRGVNHFGFTLEPGERDAVYGKLAARGIAPWQPPREGRPYIEDAIRDPAGNKLDVSTGLRPEIARTPKAKETAGAK